MLFSLMIVTLFNFVDVLFIVNGLMSIGFPIWLLKGNV